MHFRTKGHAKMTAVTVGDAQVDAHGIGAAWVVADVLHLICLARLRCVAGTDAGIMNEEFPALALRKTGKEIDE